MLGLPNFCHINTFIGDVMDTSRLCYRNLLFQNTLTLKNPTVANYDDIIKIATMIIKTTLKCSKLLKEVEIML